MINLYCLKLQVTLYYKVKVDKISAEIAKTKNKTGTLEISLIKATGHTQQGLGNQKFLKKKGSSGGLVCLYEKSTVDCRGNIILFPIRGKLF